VIDSLVNDGNAIIFGTSFGYQNCMVSEAKKYPNVKFLQATGTVLGTNLSEYYGAGEDAIYLSGIAAGAASKNGLVGYVVPFAIPEVIRHTNAFTLGVQTAHPGAKVKIIWTSSWFAPAKEKQAAGNLKAAGVDVLGQNVDSPATGQYAESAGVPWVGYDSNAQKFAPKEWLTGAVYNWGPYYLSQVKAVMNGTWKSAFYYGSLKSGFAELAPYGPNVSAKTKALIASRLKAIENGSWYEFQGPLYDQSGKLRVKKGQRLTVQQLYSINWLVKGVIGSPKG
jgi:basic membrane protein A